MNIGLILIVLVVAILGYVIALYNSLASLKVKIKEAWSQIDVQLKRRIDLIPNLVETVKGYASHEKEVFENVTQARAALLGAKTPEQAGQADNMLQGALKSLFAVAEAYPELKAQEGFVNLQKELSDTEDKVAYARQFYNSVVRQFNEKIVVFPANLLAGMLGFTQEQFFEASEDEKSAVKVDF
ncbi:LemA family protein [candidate division WWE3 bacterium]|jgi:LemA protein|uniref:LemA family protein n=1 Tax=candidate division WWE3 bacterium TaxID=2053526 RepID=A0A3A4ZBE5_UNCKA|nr:MAG: LemA family protein [candidate division WWE3 bacterium]